MTRPTVTLVTPSWNQARYLRQTLRSVIAQRGELHEYFVLDGGSTDGSAAIIKEYEKDIDYWVSQKDAGQTDAITRGFARATGDVLGWLNSDDLLLPGALAAVREAFELHPELDVVTANHVAIDQDDRVKFLHRMPPIREALVRLGVHYFTQPTTFFRRRAYEAVGGLDVRWHGVMDTDLWLRFLRAGCRWGFIPQYLAAFRHHAEQKQVTLTAYPEETRQLSLIYPEFFSDGLKYRFGLTVYRLWQVASLRYPRARLESMRHRGEPVDQLFASMHAS